MAHYHGYQRTDGSIQQRILPLLTPIWEDHELNDISFLKADTFSWQSGSVYQAVYQHLEQDIALKTLQSETISGITIQYYLANDGHKICPASEESNVDSLFNLVGVAKYFILDTDNTRFKVYREKYNKYSTELPVKGNGINLGFTNGIQNFGMASTVNNPNNYLFRIENYGQDVGSVPGATNAFADLSIGITTDSSKSGIISSSVSDSDMILYFYVGEFTQSAMANTAGINAELFNQKQDLTIPHIIDSSETATGGYVLWSNGYYEEWGEIDYSSSGAGFIVTSFSKTFSKTPNIQITLKGIVYNNYLNAQHSCNAQTVSTTAFTTYIDVNVKNKFWKACGFLAEGQY